MRDGAAFATMIHPDTAHKALAWRDTPTRLQEPAP